jgi:hypothetical protein
MKPVWGVKQIKQGFVVGSWNLRMAKAEAVREHSFVMNV